MEEIPMSGVKGGGRGYGLGSASCRAKVPRRPSTQVAVGVDDILVTNPKVGPRYGKSGDRDGDVNGNGNAWM